MLEGLGWGFHIINYRRDRHQSPESINATIGLILKPWFIPGIIVSSISWLSSFKLHVSLGFLAFPRGLEAEPRGNKDTKSCDV